MKDHLTLSEIKEFGEKLRKTLWELQYGKPIRKLSPAIENLSEIKPQIAQNNNGSRVRIRSLRSMLPDWVIEIAELSFKDLNRKVEWNPEFLLGLEFTKPIL